MKSKIVLLVVAIAYLCSFQKYAPLSSYIKGGGDAWGYYVYLPSAFIYNDLKDLQQTLAKRAELSSGSVRIKENGYIEIEEAHAYKESTVVKYTCGIAVLNLPFFLSAHAFCQLTHLYPADGFSLPYTLLIGFGTLFYGLLGLWLVRKLLLKYFSDSVTAVTLAALALGTNLYYFSVANGIGMSHAYLFALYAAVLLAVDRFYDNPKKRYAVFIGFFAGFITLIRPNEIIVLLFPLLWNIFSFDDMRKRVQFVRQNVPLYILMGIVFFITVSPQVVYWLALTGKPVFYSYTGEKFDFLHPHIKGGLFGYKNGWLAYTPIMYAAVAGLLALPIYLRKSALATYVFLLVHVYIIYSWWCWTYINGFGSRPMVEVYAILALPFASFLSFIGSKKTVFKILTAAFLLFCTLLNLFQTWQFNNGLIWTEDSSFAFYRTMLFRTKMDDKALIVYDSGQLQPDTSDIRFVKVLGEQPFNDSVSQEYVTDVKNSGKFAFKVTNGFTPSVSISAKESGLAKSDYLNVSCWAYCLERQPEYYHRAVLVAEFKHHEKTIAWRTVRLVNYIGNQNYSFWHSGVPNQSNVVSFFVRPPYNFSPDEDTVNLFVWNPTNTPIIIDDIRMEQWSEK